MPKAGGISKERAALLVKLNKGTLAATDIAKEYSWDKYNALSAALANKNVYTYLNGFDRQINEELGLASTQSVNLSNISTLQTALFSPKVSDIMHNKNSSELPKFVKFNGDFILVDGNHRVAAAMLSGKKSIKATVLDADKILK